jgi:hypothetical protein
MAERLNYRNPKASKLADELQQIREQKAEPRMAIPAEFDTLLTRTDDLPAAAAIEKILIEQKISFFRTHDGRAVHRTVELHVRSADQPRAGELAAGVFVRRKKFKSMQRPEMPQMPGSSGRIDLPHLPGGW